LISEKGKHVTLHSDSVRFSRALTSAILWPVGIIVFTALLVLLFMFETFQVVKLSDQSDRVLAQTRICETLVVSSQNNVRGFLLTGNPAFVTAYESDRSQIDHELVELKSLVKKNAEQSIRAEDLDHAKDTWFEHGSTMIAHRKKNEPVNADWVLVGKSVMDDLQARFDKFIEVEESQRDSHLYKVNRMKTALGYGGTALVILLSITVAYIVRNQMMVLASSFRTALDTGEQRHAALARSEADLEEQKEWLRVTLTSIGDGVIVTDPAGRIVLMNHESERMTGWTNVEALHQPLSSVFRILDEKTRQAAEDLVEKVLSEKKVIGLRNRTLLFSRSGEEWPVDDSAAPICDAKGKILGVVIVFHDATQARLAEKSLKAHSAELEKKVADRTITLQQAVQELESFSYTVSHDLRAPLRAMQGFSDAVLESYGDKLDAQGKNYLERIGNAGKRLDRLIQDLLSYTRISRQDTPLAAVDLDKVIRDIIEHDTNLSPPAARLHLDQTFPKVLGRESSLTQVISNLLCNAVKFVPKGTIPEIKIWSEDRGPLVRLWIEDNGIGIGPDDQERIFEMFVQVNEPKAYGGTGVGLAIVKKAVQTMRGSIGVESKEGSGSRFWVELAKVP
jgi:PAS domain S-box-containing protein